MKLTTELQAYKLIFVWFHFSDLEGVHDEFIEDSEYDLFNVHPNENIIVSTRLSIHLKSVLWIYFWVLNIMLIIKVVFDLVAKCVLCIAVFGPLLPLSPPPSGRDYYFNLDDTEGVCDLFDVPLI